MTNPVLIAPAAKDLAGARRQFADLYGSQAVTLTFLKIALAASLAVNAGLVVLNMRTASAVEHYRPVIIRITEQGRPEVLSDASVSYRPQEREIKYFLIDFVRRHYSRMKATVREDYARSLFYLDSNLAESLISAGEKNQTIETFLTGPGPEIDVAVRNVSIEDLREPPYRAVVEFERVFYSSADRTEQKRERVVANVVFSVKEHVPNALIPVNPLGLTITYFREDQAFE